MANQISYTDKQDNVNKPSIPANQKASATDLNEIKNVVNNNATETDANATAIGTNTSSISTNATNITTNATAISANATDIAAALVSMFPAALAGTVADFTRKGGWTMADPASPLSTLTINEAGKVAGASVEAWLDAAADPLSAVMGVGNVKNYGYVFSANTLMRINMTCEAGGLIIGVSSSVEVANQGPSATSVAISGGTTEGNQLNLTYAFSDADGDDEDTTATGTQYDLRSYTSSALGDADTDGTGGTSVASGATLGATVNYTLTSSEVGEFLVLWIAPKSLTGTVQGNSYRSTTSAEITAAAGFVPSDLANAVLSLYPPISTSPNASIINTDEIAVWGDRSNSLLAEGTGTEPILITNAVNGLEEADFGSGSRLQFAANSLHNLSGNNFFSYMVLTIDTLASFVRIFEKGSGTPSYALMLWSDGNVRAYWGPGDSTNRIIGTGTPLASAVGTGAVVGIKVKMVAGAGEIFVDTGSGFASAGTATGLSVTPDSSILYINRSFDFDGKIQAFVLGTTMTAQEETDMDTWASNLCGV